MILTMLLTKGLVFKVIPSSHGNGTHTIGKSIKNIRRYVEMFSVDELEPEISKVKGVGAYRQEELPLASLVVTCHLEESASHHLVQRYRRSTGWFAHRQEEPPSGQTDGHLSPGGECFAPPGWGTGRELGAR